MQCLYLAPAATGAAGIQDNQNIMKKTRIKNREAQAPMTSNKQCRSNSREL